MSGLGIILLLMMAVISCSKKEETGASPRPIEISWLSYISRDSDEGKAFFPMLDKWLAQNPDIIIRDEFIGGDDRKAKVKADASAGLISDIFGFWSTLSNCAYLLQADLCVPTEDLCAKIPNVKMKNISSSILETISYKGVPYGLPLSAVYAGFFVNAQIYAECGLKTPDQYDIYTYEQFRKDGDIFKSRGYIPLACGWQAGNPGHFYLSALVNQMPGGTEEMLEIAAYKDSTGPGNITRGLQYIIDDIKLGMYQENVLADSWNEMGAIYEQKRAAAVYNYVNNSMFINIMSTDPDLLTATRMVPFPQIKEAARQSNKMVALAAEHNYYVTRKAWDSSPAKQDAIAKFCDFLYGRESMINFTKYNQAALGFDYDIPTDGLSPIVRDAIRFGAGKEEVPFYLAVVPDSTAWQNFKFALMDCVSGEVSPADTEKLIGEIFQVMERPE
jgi:raffinose/stachyose/melibiose transport system substrate-binding protein